MVFYRLGKCPGKSVCILLCDPWFEKKGEADGFLRRNEWKISFHPGHKDEIEEITDLTRWLRRVKHGRAFHDLDFCMALATIDEIKIHGRAARALRTFCRHDAQPPAPVFETARVTRSATLIAMTREQARKRHAQLADEIRRYDHAYYVEAKQIITDQQYDKLYRKLLDLEKQFKELITPDSPSQRVSGGPLEKFQQFRHEVPMMSLDNTYSAEEVCDFIKRVQKKLPNEFLEWSVEPKVDGLAVTLQYENGLFIRGATRGDGTTGDDITANLRTVRTIPLRLGRYEHLPRRHKSSQEELFEAGGNYDEEIPSFLEVRGEICIAKKKFEQLNNKRIENGEEAFANARNTGAGSLKLLDPREVRKRPLSFFAYAIAQIRGANSPKNQFWIHDWLRSFGFKTANEKWKWLCDSEQEVWLALEKLKIARNRFEFETDGAVIKLNSFAQQRCVGYTAKAPRWAIAYKYAPEQAQTKLNGITIQVGRTGALTPVAELEPVFLAGSTISRATLHNED